MERMWKGSASRLTRSIIHAGWTRRQTSLLCQVGSFKEKQSHIESERGATGWDIGDQNTMPAIFGTCVLFFVFVFSENSGIKNWHSGKIKRKKSLVSELFTLHCSSEPKGFPCKIQMWPPDSVAARTTFILVRDVSLTRLQAFSFLNLRHTMLIHCSENPRTQRVWGFNHSFNKYSLGAYNPHGDSEQTGLTQTLPLQTSRWDKQ